MKKEDPILAEIHETRRKMLEEAGGDLSRLIEQLKAREAQDQGRLVSSVPSKRGENDRKPS